MAIAADDLGRRRVRLQAQSVEHVLLDLGADVGVGADRAGDAAHADHLARSRQPLGVALELGQPAGGLEAEGHRLGVDAVAAADHRRVAMLERQASHDLGQPRQLGLDRARRVAQHDRGGGVEDVRAGQAVVQPAALGAEPLGDRAQEGDDVVLRLPLDLPRSLRVDLADLVADALVVGPRHDAGLGHRLERQHLDPQPQLELVPLAEDLAQLRQRVPLDHDPRIHPQLGPAGLVVAEGRTRSATASSESARMRAARWRGVLAPAADRDRRHRHAGRHLDDRVERIGAAQRAAVERDPDHRPRGERGEHARQVRGEPGRTDEQPHAVCLGLGDVGVERIGLAVGADDRCLPGDLVRVEHVEAALQGWQVGAGAADDGDGGHRCEKIPAHNVDEALSQVAQRLQQRRTPPTFHRRSMPHDRLDAPRSGGRGRRERDAKGGGE